MAGELERKRQELERLEQLQEYSRTMVEQLGRLADKLESMGDGAEAVGDVLANWREVVRGVELGAVARTRYAEEDYENGRALPETLVRVAVDDKGEEE